MAKINKENFKSLLNVLGFTLENGSTEEIYSKTYTKHDNYKIFINFDKEKIDYISGATKLQSIEMRGKNPDGTSVKATRKTTSNFSQAENLVVLECVNRLLEKGYEPNSIILEKSWASGRKTSEYLDILIQKDNKAHTMIECKTFGTEYQKEKNRMKKLKADGQPDGQLWAYADRENNDVKLLCLYSSHLIDDKIEYINDIIEFQDSWRTLNSRGAFDSWKKDFYNIFKNAGIFENNYSIYNTKCSQLRNLQQLTAETASRLFQDFLEVLRHNAISDKANAFNKILNIFICKIVDEDEIEENRKFWWDEHTTADNFMSTLENLYKRGMNDFLNINVTDFSDADIDKLFIGAIDPSIKNSIKEVFHKQKTERSSEFAFREIYNRQTFLENASIVREIVQLIQPYQFRYGHKHQFLGDFFEQLLSTSIKQESGQFFTPIRIAKFICSSLPLKEETNKCIASGSSTNVLPLIIDYACGSGHFLTEYMDIEQNIVNNIDRTKLNRGQRNVLGDPNNKDDDYKWASSYVYGIEKDYRLAKTTKLNTFLNGDGDANIINADGLAPFSTFEKNLALYSNHKNNNNFTFVIANPPYAIESFAATMNEQSPKCFDLWTDKMADNIECLFIERTAQLLKEGGYAAIIIPEGISFKNDSFFEHTRELLFKNFKIKAVINLSGKCFAATDVNTQILFMQKRSEKDIKDIEKYVEDFIKTGNDFSYNGIKDVIQNYLNLYGENMSFNQYVDFIKNNKIDTSIRYINRMQDVIKFEIEKNIKALKDTSEYKKADLAEKDKLETELQNETILKTIIQNETNKLVYYLLTFTDNIIIADTLIKDDCKKFTGLSFSDRSGKQGTITAKANSLVNDDNLWDDPDKLNYYVHLACLNQKQEIPQNLKKHVRWANASELFNYLGQFKNTFKADIKKKEIKPLKKNFIEIKVDQVLTHVTVPNKSKYTLEYCKEHAGNIPVYSGSTKEETKPTPVDKEDFNGNYIGFTTAGNAGIVYNIQGPFCVSSNFSLLKTIDCNNDNRYISLALEAAIQFIKRKGYSSISWENIKDLYIQLPINEDKTINYSEQSRIANELDVLNNKIKEKETFITSIDNEVLKQFNEFFGNPIQNDKNWKTARLDKNSCKNGLNYTYSDTGTSIKCLSVADFKDNFSIHNTDYLSEICISDSVSDEYLLKDNDIVFVRSNGNKLLVGRSIFIESTNKPVTFSGFCIRYRNNNPEWNNLFLVYMLKTKDVRENLFGRGSNITNLNQDMLSNLNLIVPPLQKQEEFIVYFKNKEIEKEEKRKDIENLTKQKVSFIDKYFE